VRVHCLPAPSPAAGGRDERTTPQPRGDPSQAPTSCGFLRDQTIDGRPQERLPIEDEDTRKCLALGVARGITGPDVIRTPARLFAEPGAPPFIAPGLPWEDGYSESLSSRLRDKWLNRELFTSVLAAQLITEHDQRRPHSSLCYQ